MVQILKKEHPIARFHKRNVFDGIKRTDKQEELEALIPEDKKKKFNFDTFYKKRTLLHFASKCGNFEAVKWLCSKGVKLNLREKNDGKTPVILACERRKFDIVHYLLDQGANPHLQDQGNKDLFLHAASSGSLSIMKRLVEQHEQNIFVRDWIKKTALHYAVMNVKKGNEREKKDIVQYLLLRSNSRPHVLDPNLVDNNRSTAINDACSLCYIAPLDIIKELYMFGADLRHKDKFGVTPQRRAALLNRDDVVEFIRGLYWDDEDVRLHTSVSTPLLSPGYTQLQCITKGYGVRI